MKVKVVWFVILFVCVLGIFEDFVGAEARTNLGFLVDIAPFIGSCIFFSSLSFCQLVRVIIFISLAERSGWFV